MSWTIPKITAPVDDVAAMLSRAVDSYIDVNQPDAEVVDQLGTAVSAASIIAASGAVGLGDVDVLMYGHANPEHLPQEGFATDSITVSVYAAKPEPVNADG